jgi:hypothetical protein
MPGRAPQANAIHNESRPYRKNPKAPYPKSPKARSATIVR